MRLIHGNVRFFLLALFLSGSFATHAQPVCAPAHQVSQRPSQYAAELGITSLVQGTSISAATKIIKLGALLSSHQLAMNSGVFKEADSSPLKSIFLQALYPEVTIPSTTKPNETTQFDIVFIFNLSLLDRYDLYAKPGWNYDYFSHCISKDSALKNGSLKAMVHAFNQEGRALTAAKNEIVIKSDTGVSLSYLAGIYVASKEHRDKIKQALVDRGFTQQEAADLLNWQKPYGGANRIAELTAEQVEAVYRENKGSRVFWEDLKGDQPYLNSEVWMEAVQGKTAAELDRWLRGQELLVRTISAFRIHLRVEEVVDKNGQAVIRYTNLESGEGGTMFPEEPLIVGFYYIKKYP